jgi:hypothetical protein
MEFLMQSETWVIPTAILKGIIMSAIIVGIAETTFIQSLIVASLSAIITGVFLLLATWMAAQKTGSKVEEIAQKIETTDSDNTGSS